MNKQNSEAKKGILYLIPTLLGPEASANILSRQVIEAIHKVDILLSEKPKTTRAFLKQIPIRRPIQKFDIRLLDIHTSKEEMKEYLGLLRNGKTIGIVSEAGCPGVADPGSSLVRLAHNENIIVMPLSGPCSVLLALMGSGLNGQNFAFIGYLPKKKQRRIKKIIDLEKTSFKNNQTQIFIETPYRSHHLFSDLIENLKPDTDLGLAVDLTFPTQFIATKTVFQWQRIKRKVSLKNRQVVFLIYASTHSCSA